MTATCRCGTSWSGFRAEHCTVCHFTYSGSTTGDAHRVGTHTPDTRRCLTVNEMLELGWRSLPCSTGDLIWHGKAMSDELKAKLGRE